MAELFKRRKQWVVRTGTMAEDVGSTKLKIFTFKSVLPGTYKWVA